MPSPLLAGFRNLVSAARTMWGGASLYPAISPETARERPRHPDMARDFAALLPQARFLQSISDCRWLAISSDIVGGAIRQKADYLSASGFATHYAGPDRAWGEQAEEACTQLDALCCTRGDRYDWRRLWALTVPHTATDGALFLNLTEGETGWPLVQPLEAQRIGSRESDTGLVEPKSARAYRRDPATGKLTRIYTPYAGLQILSGIIYDEAGREVAYRVLGTADDGSDDVDISAQDMIHLGRPGWISEGRPLPGLALSSMALQDIHLARQAQLTKHLHSARLIALRKNATGTPAQQRLGDPLATRTPLGGEREVVEEGQMTYIKHKDEMQPWDTKTPGGEWMAYDDRIVASALHALGWRLEMLDPKLAGTGANTRAFADQINTALMESFQSLVPAILRVRRWQIAKLIARGDLPAHADWWRWGVTPPPEFSPDPGRAISSELEAVRAGAQSMPHVHRRWGQRPRDVLNEQADYLLLRRQVAQEKGLLPDEIAQLGTLAMPGDAAAAPTSDLTPQASGLPPPDSRPDASAELSERRHVELLATLRASPPAVHFAERAIVVEAAAPVVVPAPVVQVAPAAVHVAPAPITVQAAAPVVVPAPAVTVALEAAPAPAKPVKKRLKREADGSYTLTEG